MAVVARLVQGASVLDASCSDSYQIAWEALLDQVCTGVDKKVGVRVSIGCDRVQLHKYRVTRYSFRTTYY